MVIFLVHQSGVSQPTIQLTSSNGRASFENGSSLVAGTRAAILLSMDLSGVLLTRTLTALHRQGRSDGSVALFVVSTPEALHPEAVPKLDGAAQQIFALQICDRAPYGSVVNCQALCCALCSSITFVSAETSYSRLWRVRRVQQIHRQVASRTSPALREMLFDALCYLIMASQFCDRAIYGSVVELPGFSEVYAAFRYFNAISLLVTAMWRSSAASSQPTASSSPESAAFNGSFPALPGGSGRSDARGTVLLKAVLLDWQPGGRGFVSVRELEYRDVAWRRLRKGGSGTYEVSDRSSHAWIGRVDWPGSRQLEPDPECVLKEIGCGGLGSSDCPEQIVTRFRSVETRKKVAEGSILNSPSGAREPRKGGGTIAGLKRNPGRARGLGFRFSGPPSPALTPRDQRNGIDPLAGNASRSLSLFFDGLGREEARRQ
ncbi:hypothetical protein HPB47_006178 [Ixodes persulcatus]|uniref:Uncharacterized protein n=1 Tax=Ixodes persulcatus TaxID=34615 RepID=A0AC60PAW2_IXOPE|nr:hypothetical protein HPB47_006178 [Ixodes persulcatus]